MSEFIDCRRPASTALFKASRPRSRRVGLWEQQVPDTNLAVSGLDTRLVEELGQSHRHADDNAAQQQVEDAGNVRQLERTGRLLLQTQYR